MEEKRKLTIPEIQRRLLEMGKKAKLKKEAEEKKKLEKMPAIPKIKIPKNLPVPYYNQV